MGKITVSSCQDTQSNKETTHTLSFVNVDSNTLLRISANDLVLVLCGKHTFQSAHTV